MREALLFVHPTFGVLGIFSSLWVFVEALGPNESRLRRMRIASLVAAAFFIVTWFSGGLWDNNYYPADREVLEKGSWAFLGNTMMEFKEHLFVIVLLLSLYLPILTFSTDLRRPEATRLPTLAASALVVLLAVAMEGAGVVLAGAVHIGATTMLGS